jgi:hypothetical protein
MIDPNATPFHPAEHKCLIHFVLDRAHPRDGRHTQPPYQVRCDQGCDLGRSQWQDNEAMAQGRAKLHEELNI